MRRLPPARLSASVAAVIASLLGLSSLPAGHPHLTPDQTSDPRPARTQPATQPPTSHQPPTHKPAPKPTAKPPPRPTQQASAKPSQKPKPTQKPTDKPSPPAPRCTRSGIQVPTCGLLWGIYSSPSASTDWVSGVTDLENLTGERYDIVKRYHDWSNSGSNGVFPDPAEQHLGADRSRLLFIAWTSNTFGSSASAAWRDIAAGVYDESVIIPAAQRVKAWGKPIFLDFDHEMDAVSRYHNGTEAEYVAAYQQIHDVFAAQGVRNVIWTWTPTGNLANVSRIAAMYPGDAYVDWIGFDPYNFSGCRGGPWREPGTAIGGFYQWLLDSGYGDKPFMLAEFGSAPHPGDAAAKGQWYAALGDALADRPNIKAAIAFNSYKECDFRVTADASSAAGYAELARHPHIR